MMSTVLNVVPAYAHEASENSTTNVAYTSPLPTVNAMSRTQATMDKLSIDVTKGELPEYIKNYELSMDSSEYIKEYRECQDYESMQNLRQRVNNEEHLLRQVFAKKALLQDKPIVHEKYPLLVPAFGNEDIFAIRDLTKVEKDIPKVFALENKRKPQGGMAIVDRAGFERNWRVFSERLLDLVNWNNVFIAGGAVLACLLPPPPKATKNFKCLRKYFHEDAYAGSDIDLFLYGMNEEQGLEKLKEIYEAVCNEIPYSVLAFRSAYAISIVSQFPYRHIQIILRLYSSPAEILMGFDVDSCSCGFDGSQVYMTPRCHQALVRQMNTIDITRRSPTYEMRLAKYADRGFEVEVPGLTMDRVDPMIFEKPWEDVQGLAKLLLLEKLRTPEARYAYKERSSNTRMNDSWKMQRLMSDKFLKSRLEYSSEKASDYSTVFLPWGPDWNAKKIRKIMMTKDIVLNADWSPQYDNRGYHTHPCFIGTLEEVVRDCCGSCPEVPASADREKLECFVSGPLSFIVDDPGRQTIGSFHPITAGDWSDGAYLSRDSEIITVAANSGDVEEIREMVERGVKVDCVDSLGRTPLHIAVLANQLEAVRVLLEAGANPRLALSDGRTVLHIAAQYGYIPMLQLLFSYLHKAGLEEGGEVTAEAVDIDVVNPSNQLTPLHYAILYGHVDCVEYLLENGALCDTLIWNADKSDGVSVLLLAAHCECFNAQVAIDLYKLLFAHGASLKLVDPTYSNVLHKLAQFNYVQFMKYILKNDPIALSLCNNLNGSNFTPLLQAVNCNHYSLAREMIECGVSMEVTDDAISALNAKRKKAMGGKGRYSYYYETTRENIAPILFMILNIGRNSEAAYKLFEYCVQKGADVNAIFGNSTLLSMIMSRRWYISEEMLQKEREAQSINQKLLLSEYEGLLEVYKEGEYDYAVMKQMIASQKISYSQCCSVVSSENDEEMRIWGKKYYELLDGKGALQYDELFVVDPSRFKQANNAAQGKKTRATKTIGFHNSFGGSSFGSSSFGAAPTDACPTVVNGVVARGEKRLELLKKDWEKKLEEQKKNNKRNFMRSSNNTLQGINLFCVYQEATEYGYRNNGSATDETYREMFNAVYTGDVSKVRELCDPDVNKKCVLLLCSGYDMQTPLSIAVNQGNRDMIRLVMELMGKQYTPVKVVKEVKKGKFSNYSLVAGDTEETTAFVDPNADDSHIINTCDVEAVFNEVSTFDMKDDKYISPCFSYPNQHSGFGYAFGANSSCGISVPSEEEKDRYARCSILEYLVYHNDVSLMKFVLEEMKKLGSSVFNKNVAANKWDKEKDADKYLLCSIFSANENGSLRRGTSTNVINKSIYNGNVEMVRCLVRHCFLGLNVLTEYDVTPEKKKKVTKLPTRQMNYDDADMEYDSDSCDSGDEETPENEKGTEEDKEVNEEGEGMEEEEEVDSEYADSDEEELRGLRQFQKQGKMDVKERKHNYWFPVLLCARYNSPECLQYVLDEKTVEQDMKQLESNNPMLFQMIEAAGGVEAVYQRVFSLKYYQNQNRLLLEASAANDNVEILVAFMKEMEKWGYDVSTLIKSSKMYSSLLEFSCANKYMNIAIFLIQNYKFREVEIVNAFKTIATTICNLNVILVDESRVKSKGPKKEHYGRTGLRVKVPASEGGQMDPVDPVEEYESCMNMIHLIPEFYKQKVLTAILPIIIGSQRHNLLNVLIDSETVVEDYETLMESVLNTTSVELLKVVIEKLHLKEKLMHENSRGYTSVEVLMNRYCDSVIRTGQSARMKNEIDEETDRKAEALYAKNLLLGDAIKKKMEVYSMMKSAQGMLVEMLQYALKESDGQARVLTTHEAVQKRVKMESKKATEDTNGMKRVFLQSAFNTNNNSTKYNPFTNNLTSLSSVECKNTKS